MPDCAGRPRTLWYVTLADLSDSAAPDTTHSREDARGLRHCGWQVVLLGRSSPRGREAIEPGEVAVCGTGGLASRLLYELRMVRRVLLTRPTPDLLFFRGPSTLLLLGLAAGWRRIPFAVELNGVFAYRYGHRGFRGWLERASDRFFMKHASLIVPVTAELAAQAESEKGEHTLIAVAPNGVNPDVFRPAACPRTGGDGRLVLGFLGSLYPFRGLVASVQVLAQLRRRGTDAHLVIVGDGPLHGEVELAARELGVADRVRLVGRVPAEQVAERLAGCDLMLALFERSERMALTGGSPLKVWSSLAMGKPVVLRDPGSLGHLAAIPGILSLRDGDPGAIADAIAAWWRSQGRDGLARLGEAGRQYVVEHATWAQHAQLISQALRRAIA